jgi:hypothetical protein
MKNKKRLISSFFHLLLLAGMAASLALAFPAHPPAMAKLLQVTETESPTETEPPPEGDASRPLVVVLSYAPSEERISPGQDFQVKIRLINRGQETANNVVATFTPGELTPRDTGAVIAVGTIAPGDKASMTQPLTATWDVWGKLNASISMALSYTDPDGTLYSETFVITVPVYTASGPARTATPTITPTSPATQRPQLVITTYKTDIDMLQPGAQFAVEMDVQNLGSIEARRVTMIVGGGSTTGGSVDGTPASTGGTSGAGGEFTNFAPLGSSNVQTLDNLPAGGSISARQSLIVNVTTNPGAYPLKVSFTYVDERGIRYVDDQVITLLVYSPPVVDVTFYAPMPEVFAGQPTMLPLQVANLGRKSAVLGNMRVTAEGAQVENNQALISTLEPGGFFPLDATLIPSAPGPLEIVVTIEYTDDFNEAKQIIKTFPIEVLEAPVIEPGGEGVPGGIPGEGVPGGIPGGEQPPASNETFWQRAWRFILGLIGLDSGPATPGGGEGFPPVEQPPMEEVPAKPIPAP